MTVDPFAPAASRHAAIVRPGTPADAHAIAALVASFQSELTDEPSGRGAERYLASVSSEAERGYLGSARYAYLVAESGDRLLGVAAIRDRTHLFRLFVARSHQRRGLARRLWERARDEAIAAGGTGAFTVNASMIAVPAYLALGFVASGEPRREHGITYQPMQVRAP